MVEQEYDEERDDYASLADEVNDPCSCVEGKETREQHHESWCPAKPWDEADWEPRAVANGKKFAEKHGLNWPPRTGDFDRYWDRITNGELKEI